MLNFEEVFSTKGHMLSWAVFFGGILQLLFLFYGIVKNKFSIFFPKPKYTNKIRRLLKLIIPGAIGAGVVQINLLIDITFLFIFIILFFYFYLFFYLLLFSYAASDPKTWSYRYDCKQAVVYFKVAIVLCA